MEAVDIPRAVLAGVGAGDTDAMACLTVADAEVGLMEGEGGVDRGEVLVVAQGMLPETLLPLDDLLLAGIAVGEVVDAQGTAHLGGVRRTDKDVVEMLQDVVRTTVGQVDVGVGVDEKTVPELLVDARELESPPSQVLLEHVDLMVKRLIVFQQRRIGGVVVDDVDIVIATAFEAVDKVAEGGEAVVVVDDDGNLLAVVDAAFGKETVAEHKAIVVEPVLEAVQGVDQSLPQGCLSFLHHLFFSYASLTPMHTSCHICISSPLGWKTLKSRRLYFSDGCMSRRT